MLFFDLVGGCQIHFDGRPVELRGRKGRALLAYLALHPGQPQPRERIVGLLWSETEEEKARASLRQTLKEVRQAFLAVGYDGFAAERFDVALGTGGVRHDLGAVVEALDEGRVPAALLERRRLGEAVLAGYEEIDPAFRVWLLAYRQQISDRLTRLLEAGMTVAERLDDRDRLKLRAEALINLDPTHEVACRHLMRLKAQAGDVAGAHKHYKTLWDLLDEDYGTEPADETQALMVAIKMGQVGEAPAPAARLPAAPEPPEALPRPVIVVAQLRAIEVSALNADKLLCFRHELVASLVRFREWRVGDQIPAGKPPATEGNHYLVEMTAYEAGDETKLVMTLQDLSASAYIWSEQYTLSPSNWFAVQRNIVRAIGMALRVHLSTERLNRLAGRAPVSMALHDRWLQGQVSIIGFRSEEWRQAEAIFREMTGLDENFSPAFSSLAQLHNGRHLAFPGLTRDPVTEAESLRVARRAVQIDPIDSRAHLCLAWSQALAGQYALSAESFRLAHSLNDSDPWTLISAAHGLAFMGEMAEAARLEAQMVALVTTPTRSQWGYLVGTRFLCGDYEGSISAGISAVDVISNLPGWMAAAYHHLGRRREAEAEMTRFLDLVRAHWSGADPPTDLAITRWFLHNFPIRRRADWERLRDGVHGAGAPHVPWADRSPSQVASE
ncbi:BTAD domain-containing putative transcriptional regulator [Prosthecomicrobium sp. N25]|uniref:BTAD domain-containing putative transcriptional regulator n=1 Tax=Prosthecomicrobium sp. N25 TaxID=3129254 RepID=UPI00307701E2